MNYKTHINGGILVGLYVSIQMQNKPLIPTGIFIGGTLLGSLLPDIDHRNSYIGKKVKAASKAINKLAGHRKLFHAPLAYLFLYSIALGMVKDNLIIKGVSGLFLGIFSHLILDSLTIGGLPWFFPLSKKRFSLANIKTNSKFEDIFCGILICLNIGIILDVLHVTSIFTFTHK